MEVLIIFAAVFIGVPMIIGLIFLISHIAEEKRKKNVGAFYQTEKGKAEFERLKKFHERTGKHLRSDEPNCENAESMLWDICMYYEKRFLKLLDNAGFDLHTDILYFGHLCIHNSHVYIYTDVFNCSIKVKFDETGCHYEYRRSNWDLGKRSFMISTLIDFFESLENPQTIETLVWKKIPERDFYWYIECPEGEDTFWADLVFGGMIGVARGAKKATQAEKDNTKVIVGQRNGESWCVAKGYQVEDALKALHDSYGIFQKPTKYVPLKK